jgi:DNA-binding NarL/FixJ family response regulator
VNSDREKEIITLLTRGYSDADIAEVLGIQTRTVKGMMSALYRQHGLMNVSCKRIALAVASVEHDTADIRVPHFTPRELEILHQIVEAKSNREIADMLGTTEQTIKNMTRAIFDKSGCGSRLELSMWSCRSGIRREVEQPELIGIS